MLHITLGTLYTIGNLNPYLVSYLRGVACKSKYKSCTATTASGEFLPGNADMVWVMKWSTGSSPDMYRLTSIGISLRVFHPPNAVPIHRRPVTS